MTSPTELMPGMQVRSPRKSEGVVTVVCEYGKCSHDKSRPESVHVAGTYYSELFRMVDTTEFFINLPSNWDIEEWGAEVIDNG